MSKTITVTRSQLVDLLDEHLPQMAFISYGHRYNGEPDFDVIAYYERVVNAIFVAAEDIEAARVPAWLTRLRRTLGIVR